MFDMESRSRNTIIIIIHITIFIHTNNILWSSEGFATVEERSIL